MGPGNGSIPPCANKNVANEGGRKNLGPGVIDSQSVKTTEAGGERGFDAGKKVSGRKRHIVIVLDIVEREPGQVGFKVLPHRWVVERSFAWAARFRRLARDYERLSETQAGLHFLAFAIVMLKQAVHLLTLSS